MSHSYSDAICRHPSGDNASVPEKFYFMACLLNG
jgi:hypothetical protein